jgi:hypothetical protein
VLLAGVLFLGSTGYAQSVKIRAEIPFDFVLGDRVYPAGEYVVETLTEDSHSLLVRNQTAKRSVLTPAYPTASAQPAKQTVLAFHRLGNTYFLYQAKIADSPNGCQFLRSHMEGKMAKTETMGKMETKAETVIVAANILP